MVYVAFDEYINMIKEESKWQKIKDFVNETKNFKYKDIPCGSAGKTYINYLHKAGFLSRPKKGQYSLNLHVDDNMTLYKITDFAYGDKKGKINKLIRKKNLKK